MQKLFSPLPDRETLRHGLASVFRENELSRGRLTILRRKPARWSDYSSSETVSCQFEDGTKLDLFCKYVPGNGNHSHGQRDRVQYEVEVYRRVLQPSQASTPKFYGAYTDRRAGTKWLILEYLKRSVWLEDKSNRARTKLAARWIAQFHAFHEARIASAPMRFLTTYDAQFYIGWARRVSLFANRWHQPPPWLAGLCERLEAPLARLAARPQTVIHGDYYSPNILFQRSAIRPVDWDEAAIAIGEIDLATLTQGCSPKIVNRLEAEYKRARWPDGPPSDFEGTLDLARVYVLLRWLGDEQTRPKRRLWRFGELRSVSQRLGLV